MEEILSKDLKQSGPIVLDQSRFLGYAATVTTHEQVNKLYSKLKMLHGSARHIVCAYSLPIPDQTWGQDQCDDQEFGAGRHLARIITEYKLKNIVLFGVRYYGGIHLGKRRFLLYKQTVEEALEQLRPDYKSEASAVKTRQGEFQNELPNPTFDHGSFLMRNRFDKKKNVRGRGAYRRQPPQQFTSKYYNWKDPMAAENTTFSFSKPLAPYRPASSWDEDQWSLTQTQDEWADDWVTEERKQEGEQTLFGHNNAIGNSPAKSC